MTSSTNSELERFSAFKPEDAVRLAHAAATKRVSSPFEGRSDKLLKLLREAEFEYNRVSDHAEFERQFFEEGKALEALEKQFHQFKYFWDRTLPSAKDDIGFFAVDQQNQDLLEIAECNASISEALDRLKDGLRKAIEYRYEKDDGRPEHRPGLKEFVATIRRGWEEDAPGKPFGDTFQGGLFGDDREPVSAAAKLVVFAARILDPDVSARDCETAMRAVKEG